MSGVDRLAELRGSAGVGEGDDTETVDAPVDAPSDPELAGHMKRYETIKRGLDVIQSNASAVEKLKQKNKQTANEKARKSVMQQMDAIMASTNQYGHAIKSALDEIKGDNAAYDKANPDSAKSQIRLNLYQTHIRRFQQVMNDYNTAAHTFKQDLQKRTRREIRIVDSDLTEAEIDDIVDSGRAQDVIKQALVSDNLQDVVRVIEERHADILKLEQQVLEIYELFRDLATLVDLQQESLDVIENRIMHAKNYTEKAEVELQEAEEYQRKARSRRCCCLLIILGILAVVLAPTLSTALSNA
jgi:syntaxin 1B/2/3